jgi:hypothetical protein
MASEITTPKVHSLNCGICFESYDDSIKKPIALYPCGHTFCNQCIDQIGDSCPNDYSKFSGKTTNWELLRIVRESIQINQEETDNFVENQVNIKDYISKAFNSSSQHNENLNAQENDNDFSSLGYTILNNLKFLGFFLINKFFVLSVLLISYYASFVGFGFGFSEKCIINWLIPIWTYSFGFLSLAILLAVIIVLLYIKKYYCLNKIKNEVVKTKNTNY